MLNTVDESKAQFAIKADNAYGAALFHSQRVRRLKILLPVGALIISLIFIAVSIIRTYLPENISIEGAKIENGKVVMEKPAISGRNTDGISYSMVAERALQDIKNPNLITLENIKAAMPVNDNVIARVEAASGDFDRSNDSLNMTAPFTIVLSNGISAHFKSARLDTKAGKLETQQDVAISKGGASIVAQSLKMTDKGQVITFRGNVRMNVDSSAIRKQGS